jgi:hypothetical protein
MECEVGTHTARYWVADEMQRCWDTDTDTDRDRDTDLLSEADNQLLCDERSLLQPLRLAPQRLYLRLLHL